MIPTWHHGIEWVERLMKHFLMQDDICALPHIVEDKHQLYEEPTYCDILSSAMSKIGIKCLGPRRTEEYGSQNQKPIWALNKQPNGIIGIQSFDDQWIMNDMDDTKQSKHQEPNKHERSEVTTDKTRTKALDKKYDGKNSDDNWHDRNFCGIYVKSLYS